MNAREATLPLGRNTKFLPCPLPLEAVVLTIRCYPRPILPFILIKGTSILLVGVTISQGYKSKQPQQKPSQCPCLQRFPNSFAMGHRTSHLDVSENHWMRKIQNIP